jgi:hypothetical protein
MSEIDAIALDAVMNSLKRAGLSWPHGDREMLKGLIRIYFGDISTRLIAELEKIDKQCAAAQRAVDSLQVAWKQDKNRKRSF